MCYRKFQKKIAIRKNVETFQVVNQKELKAM